MVENRPLQQLVATDYLGAADAVLYTSPFSAGMNGVTVVTGFILANVTAGAVAATLYNVPSGGTVGNRYAIVPGSSMPANTAWWENRPDGILVVPAGGSLYGKAGAGSSITFCLYGREIP